MDQVFLAFQLAPVDQDDLGLLADLADLEYLVLPLVLATPPAPEALGALGALLLVAAGAFPDVLGCSK